MERLRSQKDRATYAGSTIMTTAFLGQVPDPAGPRCPHLCNGALVSLSEGYCMEMKYLMYTTTTGLGVVGADVTGSV